MADGGVLETVIEAARNTNATYSGGAECYCCI